MENILEFLENNYIWFLVAAVVLLLALIGFMVDSKRKQKKMEGNLDSLDKNEMTPAQEFNANTMPTVDQPVTFESNTVQNEMPQMETPVQESVSYAQEPAAVNPVEFNNPTMNTTETFNFDSNPVNSSETMTFNDIPTPSAGYEMPMTESVPEVKEEIIEPFNVGNPVVMDQTPVNPAVQPNVQSTEESVINIE